MVGWDSPNQLHKSRCSIMSWRGVLTSLVVVYGKKEEVVGLATSYGSRYPEATEKQEDAAQLFHPSKNAITPFSSTAKSNKWYHMDLPREVRLKSILSHVIYLELFHWEWSDELARMVNVTESARRTGVYFLFYKHKPIQYSIYLYKSLHKDPLSS